MTALRFRFMALSLLLALASAPCVAGQDRLTIVTASGPRDFSVEVMRSQADLEKGLMFRRTMAADKGMLFDFGAPRQVSMWMKNTYLALDMLFIGRDGTVASVKEHAVPMSEDIIASSGPVMGVLEVNAGTVKRLGIKPGDHVRHPMFGAPEP